MILVTAGVPFLVGILGARTARRVAIGMPPALAVALLTGLAASVSLGCAAVLLLGGALALAEAPAAALDPTSVDTLRDHVPIPPGFGWAGAAIALFMITSFLWHALQLVKRSTAVDTAAAALRPVIGNLVIVHAADTVAYALPGRQQRIVVSTGLLRLLSAPQRRALLAHEAAHLRYHHQRYVQLGRLTTAANPLLRPVARAIELAVERWADEIAARDVGDRVTVANAVAAAALASGPTPQGSLAGSGSAVLDRVDVLLAPRRPIRPFAAALTTVGAAACWASALLLADHLDDLIELAQRIGSRR